MTEEMKQRVAVFRFGVIADFVDGRQLQWGETERQGLREGQTFKIHFYKGFARTSRSL
ncbi:MAG: hypothetical protein AB1410_03620 [Acidobacteriota bacterium]